MKKLVVAASSLAAVLAVSAVGLAQQVRPKTLSPAPAGVGTKTLSVSQWVAGFPCEVVTDGDTTTVFLTAESYCGGSGAGTFVVQRQYGVGVDSAQAQLTYDMYPRLVERMIDSPWRRVAADVTGSGTYARSLSFRSSY